MRITRPEDLDQRIKSATRRLASDDSVKASCTSTAEAKSHVDPQVRPDYSVVVTTDRRYREVSESFCKLLGYRREELIGRKYDDFTAPMTNDVQVVLNLFLKTQYMHGIWILVHREGTKILVRYESWIREDGLFESHMELLGAGA
jgi:PAS domain S-box-containing protein